MVLVKFIYLKTESLNMLCYFMQTLKLNDQEFLGEAGCTLSEVSNSV